MATTQFERLSFAIIEDNAHVRRLLRTILHSFGCREVYEADDGASGLEVLDSHVPDIVITDLDMPVFDGFDLVRTIRNPKACKTPKVPIIMLTGYAEKSNVLRARDLGVTEFICKPFSADTLYKRIRTIVERPRPFVETKHYYGPEVRPPLSAIPAKRHSPHDRPEALCGPTEIDDQEMEIEI
ncbi:MAG: response regulator [Hyphomicrobiales bacterium]